MNPTLPAGLIWGLFTDTQTGRLILVNQEGEAFGFDPTEAPHVAAVLADHCQDNDERSMVRDRWYELDDWDLGEGGDFEDQP